MHFLEAVRTKNTIFTKWDLYKNKENGKSCLWKVAIKTTIRESKTLGFGFDVFLVGWRRCFHSKGLKINKASIFA